MSRRLNQPTFLVEQQLAGDGYGAIAGLDEVGRGAWAGPLVAAAVILPSHEMIPGLRDSKLLSPQRREELAAAVTDQTTFWAIGVVTVAELDANGLTWANRTALERAFCGLPTAGDFALVDGLLKPVLTAPCRTFVRGDATIASIAAASIVAKVARDRMMRDLDDDFPAYGFGNHKGYGTTEHLAALQRHGPTPQHRRSFAPVREVLGGPLPFARGGREG